MSSVLSVIEIFLKLLVKEPDWTAVVIFLRMSTYLSSATDEFTIKIVVLVTMLMEVMCRPDIAKVFL